MLRLHPIALFCLMLPISMIFAGRASADAIDSYVRSEMKRQHIPGLSIAVVRNGKIVKTAGYGYANLEHKVLAKPETIYQSGSVGKQFTAALVMLLVRDGKIALHDPISKHLPGTPDAWKGITIRHLLTHTAGLGEPYNNLDLRKDYSDEDLLKIDGAVPMQFAPGEKWAYSNMGYHVLGFLCNKVGGKFYVDQLKKRIFGPSGMKTARIISEADIVPNRAAGYEWVNGDIKNQSWVSPTLNTTADGSLYLTVLDMANWDLALNTNIPLDKSIRKQIWTPVTLNNGKTYPYGFGWEIGERNGHKLISHSGAWQGFTTQISRFVDDKLTVIVLTNLAGTDPGRIANHIAGLVIPALRPIERKSIADLEPTVTAMVRDTLLRIADGTLTSDRFTPATAKVLFPDIIKSSRAEFVVYGTLKSLELLDRTVEGEKRTFQYRAHYPETELVVRVTLTKYDKIEGIRLSPAD